MKALLVLCLCFSPPAFAGLYFGLFTGSPQTEYETIGEEKTKALLASEAGMELGYLITPHFSIEVSRFTVNFNKEQQTLNLGTGDVLSYEFAPEFTNTGFGLRFFFLNYFTAKIGSLKTTYEGNWKATGTGTTSNFLANKVNNFESEVEGTGSYAGIGVHYPVSIFNLYAEYQVLSIELASTDDDQESQFAAQGMRAGFRVLF